MLKNNLEEIIEDKMKHGMVSYGRNGFKGTVSRDGFDFLMTCMVSSRPKEVLYFLAAQMTKMAPSSI